VRIRLSDRHGQTHKQQRESKHQSERGGGRGVGGAGGYLEVSFPRRPPLISFSEMVDY
jgi:hypothetical protein